MVAMNDKYASKGLVMLGISLDQDKAKMLAVAKEKKFTWPQYFDGKVWQNDLWAASGAPMEVPFTVLIEPKWKGRLRGPSGKSRARARRHLQSHASLHGRSEDCRRCDETARSGRGENRRERPQVGHEAAGQDPPAAKSDETFADRDKDVEKKLQAAAEEMLGEVDPLVTAGNYPEAISKLRELSDGLAGSPTGVKAKKELADLLAKAEAKAAMAKARRMPATRRARPSPPTPWPRR